MRTALKAAVIATLYIGTGLFDHGIWSPTEPTVAGIVWNMQAHGELAVPRINEFVYLEKPPLYYWMALGVSRLTGALNPVTLRLPSVIMGLACLGLVYWIGRRRYGETVACLLALMGATSVRFYMLTHRASTDTAAMFFCFLCFALFARTVPMTREMEREGDAGESLSPRATLGWDVLLALALAVSFFSKNFYPFLIVLPPIVACLAWWRELRRILRLAAVTALFLTALLIPWCLELYESGGLEYLRIVFFDNTIGRFFTIADHGKYAKGVSDAFTAEKESSPLFYLRDLLVISAPWMFVLLIAIVAFFKKAWRCHREGRSADAFDLFLGMSFASILFMLTLSSSKASQYLSPILIIELWLMGDLLSDFFQGRRPWELWERGLVGLNVVLVGLIVTLFPVAFALQGFVSRTYALLAIPLLAVAIWLLRRLHRGGVSGGWACEAGWAICVALFLALLVAMPMVDRRKGYASFFENVRPHTEGLRLYVADSGDHRLPMINYFLRTRVEIIDDAPGFIPVLRGLEPAGVFLHEATYNMLREQIVGTPGLFAYPEEGARVLVFVSNRGPR